MHSRDLEKSIIAGQTAAKELRQTSPETRSLYLQQLRDLVTQHAEDLCILECLQTGRTYQDVMQNDLAFGIKVLDHAIGLTQTVVNFSENHHLGAGLSGLVRSTARPLSAALLPSTEPLGSALRKLAISLTQGASLILIAPVDAPLSVLRLAALTRETIIPVGAIGALSGRGQESAELVAKSAVDTLSYSGPLDIARRVVAGAAKSNLKPVSLELETKNAALIFEDADISRATRAIWRSSLTSFGQLNRSIGRVLVHQSRFAEVSNHLALSARSTLMGDPLDDHTELGPMVSPQAMQKALAYVELARKEGASLVAGGSRDVEGYRYAGHFVQPTVLVHPPADGRVVREPIIGPIISVEPFSTEKEALEKTTTCLGKNTMAIFSSDLSYAQKLANELDVGQVWINHSIQLFPSLPHQASGEVSAPNLGKSGLNAISYDKSIIVNA